MNPKSQMKKLLLYAVTIVNMFCFLGIADAGPLVIGDPPMIRIAFRLAANSAGAPDISRSTAAPCFRDQY